MKKIYTLLISLLLSLVLNAQVNLGNHNSYFNGLTKQSNLKTKQLANVRVSNKETVEVNIYTSTENLITGGIEGVDESIFLINHSTTETSGFLIKDKKTSYRISTNTNGDIIIKNTEMKELMCVDYTSESKEEKPSQELSSHEFEYEWDPYDLNSNPEEAAVIFLDFDGYYLPSGTAWNSGNSMNCAPPVGWSDMDILVAWNILKEDFAPFKVNVTTNEAVFNAASVGNRTRALFTNSVPNQGLPTNVVGVAITGSFQFNWDSPCWVFTSRANVMASSHTASHEVGHAFSLQHDGKGSTAYYAGHNDWSPIMGNSDAGNLSQWSKGDYVNATQPNQDDVQIIANMVGGMKIDVIGNSKNSAEEIIYTIDAQGVAVVEKNDGLIETRTDVDVWHFYLAGGTINLDIIPKGLPRTNLDIEVKLYDENDNLITTVGTGHQNFTDGVNITRVLAAGDYYIHVDGVGTGTGPTVGWTDYGCMGYYRIQGTIEGIEQKNNDVAVVNIGNIFSKDCGSSISPEIELLNGGKLLLQSVNIQVLLDGVSVYDQNNAVNVSSGASEIVSIGALPITTFGNKVLQVILSSPNGQVDEIPSNNTKELSFNMGAGQLYEFSISSGSVSANMDWRIKEGQTTLVSNSQITVSNSNGMKVQQFCVSNGCYNIVVTDAFLLDLCNQYSPWNSSTLYATGDKFVYLGRVYEANTAIWGVDPIGWAQYFNDLGPCPSPVATDYYSFKNLHTGDVIVNETVASYSSPNNTAFCGEDNTVVSSDFSINNANPSHCETVIFTAQTTGIVNSYSWNFGVDASPATANGVGPHAVRYLSDGNKSVSLTVNGSETEVKTNYVTVSVNQNLLPTASIALNGNPQCEGDNVSFVITERNQGNSPQYNWYVNNQLASSQKDFSTTSLLNGGFVRLRLTSNDECAITNEIYSNSLVVNLSPVIIPTVSISSSTMPVCEAAVIDFTSNVSPNNNMTITWYVNGSFESTGNVISLSALSNNDIVTAGVVSSENCAITTEVISNPVTAVVEICTGVSDRIKDFELAIYPNPAENTISIESEEMINTLRVLDLTGSVIYSMDVLSESTNINIEGLESGFYVVKVQVGNEVIARSIIKK